MFGYVTINAAELNQAQRDRYQAYYCGLCRALQQRHGNLGRVTLSNDLTFLYLLLSSLYEPEEQLRSGRCPPHPLKARGYVVNELAAYCADMNIALAWHKCQDDWKDDRSLAGRAEARLLDKSYRKVAALYPEKCKAIVDCLHSINALEKDGSVEPDGPANLTALMLGEIYAWRNDYWAEALRTVGEALGRFIYVMDAYDDLAADEKRGRYNPLMKYREQPDFEGFCKDSLTLLIAECTQTFEELPLTQDIDILRNILYSGVWMRYAQKQARRDRGKLKETTHEGPL